MGRALIRAPWSQGLVHFPAPSYVSGPREPPDVHWVEAPLPLHSLGRTVAQSNVLSRTARKKSESVQFRVDPRLATLLGEGYRSSEYALKELVDNAWDADATRVEVTLPPAFSSEPIVIADNGSGMTRPELEHDYLVIANDRRTRKGELTHGLRRPVKGRKGIGKFAGLMVADVMNVETRARGNLTSVRISKEDLPANGELEAINLPVVVGKCAEKDHGTTIRLSNLAQTLDPPSAERFKQLLVLEYGRQEQFEIVVNGEIAGVEDIPGQTFTEGENIPGVGPVSLCFTVADGKKPLKQAGIAIRVTGKIIGKPTFLGLEDDEELPPKLLRKVYGELEADGLVGSTTADWGAVIENSKAFAAVAGWGSQHVKNALSSVFANEVSLAKARQQQQINRALALLPEHRRAAAATMLDRVVGKLYGEVPERIDTVISLMLSALENTEYFTVVKAVDEASHQDVMTFARALDDFGLRDMAMMADQAHHRMRILDQLTTLLGNDKTLEAEMHRALEHNLWVLGSAYALIASNATLKSTLERWSDKKFTGARAARRPDLLLAGGLGARHVLIEFKRPSHRISRDDENQAVKYRDDLRQQFPNIEILMVGAGSAAGVDAGSHSPDLQVISYAGLVSRARTELEWLLTQLNTTVVERASAPDGPYRAA
jgi:hypothetical protein